MTKKDVNTRSFFGEPSIGVWMSDTHTVAAFADMGSVRLDICRNDFSDGMTWDELMEIKTRCGFADSDGVEFYPREKDVINTSNIRHIYIFKDKLPLIRRL